MNTRRNILTGMGTLLVAVPLARLAKADPQIVEVKVEWGLDMNYWGEEVGEALDDAWARVRNRSDYHLVYRPELFVRMTKRS